MPNHDDDFDDDDDDDDFDDDDDGDDDDRDDDGDHHHGHAAHGHAAHGHAGPHDHAAHAAGHGRCAPAPFNGPGWSCLPYGRCLPRALYSHVAGANGLSTFQNVLTCGARPRRCC